MSGPKSNQKRVSRTAVVGKKKSKNAPKPTQRPMRDAVAAGKTRALSAPMSERWIVAAADAPPPPQNPLMAIRRWTGGPGDKNPFDPAAGVAIPTTAVTQKVVPPKLTLLDSRNNVNVACVVVELTPL